MKFLLDSTLGKLAKWLRILGYDTLFIRQPMDDETLKKAAAEGRVLLTRKVNAAYAGSLLVVMEDRLKGQIGEISENLELSFEPKMFFTRCLRCNQELVTAIKQEIVDAIPSYVLSHYTDFRICRSCGKIYWPGTHRDRMLKFIQTRNRAYPL